MKTIFVCLLGALCLFDGVQSAPSGCNAEALKQGQLECLRRYNVTLGGDSAEDVTAILQNNPTAMCTEDFDAYAASLHCVFGLSYDCLREIGASTSLLPDADNMVNGSKYLCQNKADYDATCTNFARPRIENCVKEQTASAIQGLTTAEEITCAVFQLTYDCMKDRLTQCGQRNLELNLAYTNEFVRPPACASFDPDGNDYPRPGEPIASTLAPVGGFVTSGSGGAAEISRKVVQCFVDAGIEVETQSTEIMDFFHTVPFDENYTQSVCRDKAKYNQAFTCTLEVTRQYLPTSVLDYLPQTSVLSVFLDDLCDFAEKNYINFTCTASKVTEYRNCSLRKASEREENREDQSNPCIGLYLETECHTEILRECGCRTDHLFVKLFKGLNPPKCPSIDVPTPTCDPVTGDYSDQTDNGAKM